MDNTVVVSQGGQSLYDLFPCKLNDAKDGYDFYDVFTTPGTPAKVTSATRATATPLTLTEYTGRKPSPQADGTMNDDITNYDSRQDFWSFLDVVALPADSSSTAKEYTLENGIKRTSASAGGWYVLAVPYGAKNTNKTPNQMWMNAFLATVDPTSGSMDTNAEDQSKPTISLKGAKTEANLTIPVALLKTHASDPTLGMLDTEDVTTWAPVISKGRCFVRKWVNVPHS
jgi:hypothetical protein